MAEMLANGQVGQPPRIARQANIWPMRCSRVGAPRQVVGNRAYRRRAGHGVHGKGASRPESGRVAVSGFGDAVRGDAGEQIGLRAGMCPFRPFERILIVG